MSPTQDFWSTLDACALVSSASNDNIDVGAKHFDDCDELFSDELLYPPMYETIRQSNCWNTPPLQPRKADSESSQIMKQNLAIKDRIIMSAVGKVNTHSTLDSISLAKYVALKNFSNKVQDLRVINDVDIYSHFSSPSSSSSLPVTSPSVASVNNRKGNKNVNRFQRKRSSLGCTMKCAARPPESHGLPNRITSSSPSPPRSPTPPRLKSPKSLRIPWNENRNRTKVIGSPTNLNRPIKNMYPSSGNKNNTIYKNDIHQYRQNGLIKNLVSVSVPVSGVVNNSSNSGIGNGHYNSNDYINRQTSSVLCQLTQRQHTNNRSPTQPKDEFNIKEAPRNRRLNAYTSYSRYKHNNTKIYHLSGEGSSYHNNNNTNYNNNNTININNNNNINNNINSNNNNTTTTTTTNTNSSSSMYSQRPHKRISPVETKSNPQTTKTTFPELSPRSQRRACSVASRLSLSNGRHKRSRSFECPSLLAQILTK